MASPPRTSSIPRPTRAPSPPRPITDPFLAQVESRNIPITDRDRQEGYDVDLVHAQPRRTAPAPAPAGVERIPSRDLAGAAAGGATIPHAYGEFSDDEGKRHTGESYGGITSTDPFLLEGAGAGGALAADGEELSKRQRTKRWILRPLPLALLIGFLCALALALGLGIGLTKEHNADKAAAMAATSVSKHTTATPDVSGTVIPSSLVSSTTKPVARTTASPTAIQTAVTSSSAAAAGTTTISSSSTTKEVVSPITSASYASTGDIPIPADTVTTKDGTVYSSATIIHKREWTTLPSNPRAQVTHLP